jgi:hypothetical protein
MLEAGVVMDIRVKIKRIKHILTLGNRSLHGYRETFDKEGVEPVCARLSCQVVLRIWCKLTVLGIE